MLRPWNENKSYWIVGYDNGQLDTLIEEVREIDPESGRIFRDAVESGHISNFVQVRTRRENGNVQGVSSSTG